MKEDKLEQLMKESLVHTSDDFTNQLLGKVAKRESIAIRKKLYILLICVTLFFSTVILLVIRTGFQFSFLGTAIEISPTGPLAVVGLLGCLTILHLSHLVRLTNR